MDLATFYNRFCESWEHVEVDLKEATGNVYRFNMNLTAEKYFDDGIYVSITAYASGTLHVFFTFDKIERNITVYNLINELNDNNSWFKAYITTINNTDYLELKFANICGDDVENMLDCAQHAFDELLSEGTLKLLKPLTNLTHN